MHRSLSLLAVACALAACSSDAPAPAGSTEVPAATPVEPPRGSEDESTGTTRLTIYSGDYEALAGVDRPQPGMPGYALVERPLHYSLKEGLNTVSATGVPPAIDAEAAVLRAQSAAGCRQAWSGLL